MCRLQINAALPHAKTFAPHCASKDYKNKPYNAPTIHRAWSQTIAKRVTKCRFVLFSMSPGFYRVFEYEYCYDNHAGTEAVQAQWLWLVLCFHIS